MLQHHSDRQLAASKPSLKGPLDRGSVLCAFGI
jgi:hypothetical protein